MVANGFNNIMTLERTEPLVIEAKPQKSFPHEWIKYFSVIASSVDTGSASFEILPYNSDTKEIGEDQYKELILVDDLFACVAEVPEAAQAYGAILAAIGPVRAWVEARKAEKELENQPVE